MNTSVEKLIEKLKSETDSIQKAKLIHILHFDKTLSLKEIAAHLKKHPSYISHYLRILQLPTTILDGYYSKQISPAHLFILSRLRNETDIQRAYKEILTKSLTTVQAEELIRQIKFTVSTTNEQLSKEKLEGLIAEIKKVFPQIQLKIVQTRIKGKIIMELKGPTGETSEFIKQISNRITKASFPENLDDTTQVLE